MVLIEAAAALIRSHEGCRLAAYEDTRGNWTVGWGQRCEEGATCTQAEADQWLGQRIAAIVAELDDQLAWFAGLDAARQAVLIDMAYNLGVAGLLGFHHTLNLIAAHDFGLAARAMLASDWAGEVGVRAEEDAAAMQSGVLPA